MNKKNGVLKLILILIIALSMYGVKLVHMHAYWFELSKLIEDIANYSFFTIPLLIILAFFNKFVKVVSIITMIILILVLSYGFIYDGVNGMLTHNLHFTIMFSIGILVLIIILLRSQKDCK